MTTASSILGIVPGLMATSLVVHNIPKNLGMKNAKKMGVKRMVNLGVTNLVGIGVIGATASLVNKI